MITNSDEDFLNAVIEKPALIGEFGGNSMERFKRLFYKEPVINFDDNVNLLRRRVLLAVEAVGLRKEYYKELGGVKKNTFNDFVKYVSIPRLQTLHQIAYLLQINPIVLFLTKVDLESYREIINCRYQDLKINSDIIKSIHEQLNTGVESDYKEGLKVFRKHIPKFTRQLESAREIWPAKIGAAIGTLLSNQKGDILTWANVVIMLSKDYYK
jgi:hypothetical protein